MGSTTGRLLGFAIVCALIGAAVIASWSDANEIDGIWSDVVRRFEVTFASGAWRWLLRATLVTVVVAVALTALEALLSVRREPRRPEYDELAHANVRGAIAEVRSRIQELTRGAKPNVVASFDELVRGATAVTASDIHMSPTAAGFKLTYRVHGTLHDVAVLDLAMAQPLATRVKVLARLDTYVRNTPQDGRLVMAVGDGTIEARVSTLPTEGGERIVLRLVRGSRTVPDVGSLEFSDEMVRRLKDVLSRPQGLFFVTGPVGSGKTTTLYASMQYIAKSRGSTTSLVTLEDPIELELPFATQTQMHARTGMTFAGTLRSVLRQDPNVLMVGEIRDKETADIAVQAGLTGHLILTTVHGEGAAGPFARLLDMDIESFALASATVGSLSQRLVRTLCTACRLEAEPDPMHTDRFTKHNIVLPPGPFYEPVGCDYCEGEGFTGRAPIGELLVVNSALREAINLRRTTAEIYDLAVAEGMVSLLRDGLARVERGETSIAEVVRVAG